MSLELGALAESVSMLSGRDGRHILTCFLIARSFGETSTRADILLHLFRRLVGRAYQLQAPSYEEAVKRAGATDYRPPTTYRLASTASSSGVSGVLATALSAATRIWRE